MNTRKNFFLKATLIILLIVSCWQLKVTWQQCLDSKPVVANTHIEDWYDSSNALAKSSGKKTDYIFLRQNKKGITPEMLQLIKEKDIFFNSLSSSESRKELAKIPEETTLPMPGASRPETKKFLEDNPEPTPIIPEQNSALKEVKPITNPFILLAVAANETNPRGIILNKNTGWTYIIKPEEVVEGYQVLEIKQKEVLIIKDGQQLSVQFSGKGLF